ncbi:MAG: ATP-binding protein [Chloroflexota bacterium]|nr:ATP-binding protein [Chloroflexota bacterium]
MRLVLAAEDGLNVVSCDRLVARLAQEKAISAPEITIDLRSAAFVDPFGAAFLVLIVRQIASRVPRLVCVLPMAERAQRSVVRMGLVRLLGQVAEVRNLPSSRDHFGQGITLPLSAIRTRVDVKSLLEFFIEQARQKLGYDLSDVLDATKVVSELCYNVVDHSGSEGLAVAQVAQDRRGQRFVSLAVVDPGVGIRASLARRFPEAAEWQHGEAIDRALGGLSSRPKGGGVGLRSVETVVRRYGGRLTIRSGDDRLLISAERRARIISTSEFYGTQVGISFSQK